jgi:chemotaxis protein CheX
MTLLSGDNLACDILPPELREADEGKACALHTATCLTTPLGDVCLDIRLSPRK